MSSEINLLPQKRLGFFTEERILLFTRIGAIASVIIVVCVSILFFLLSRDPTLSQQKTDEDQTIAQLNLLQNKTAKYLIIIDRINKIKLLSKQKSHFEDSLTTLVSEIPDTVAISALSLDKSSVSVGVSSSNLSSIGLAIENFSNLISQKKVLKTLTIQGLVTDEKAGTYILTFTGDLL